MDGELNFLASSEQQLKEQRQKAISGLQRALILMSAKAAPDWIEANGERFRRLVKRRPEFLDRFNTEDGEAVAQEVRDLMFIEED
ncbi:MAG: hypothetical protein V1846_02260 [Candidatus Komeilibacteria bacterium]